MRNVLAKIFNNNNFTVKCFANGDYYSSNEKSENYIVYFVDDLCKVNIDEILDEKILNISLDHINKEMKKNTSVIFVTKTDNSELSNQEKKIVFKIEEDPYFYKKYVLWYTEEELTSIQEYMDDMTKHLMNKELFQNMKEVLENDNVDRQDSEVLKVYSYILLCRMFIKLPFLSLKTIYNNPDSNELQNFEKKIELILDKYRSLVKELDNDNILLDIELSDTDKIKYLDKIEKDLIS